MPDDFAPDRVEVVTSALPQGAATEATLGALNTKDFATQGTLQALLSAVQGLSAAQAREVTLGAVLGAVDGIEGLLAGTLQVQQTNNPTTTDITDRAGRVLGRVEITNPSGQADVSALARETTLGSILAQLDDASADTVLSVLKSVLGAVQQRTRPSDAQTVTGAVNVSNFPPDPTVFPLPPSQVEDLKVVRVTNFPDIYANVNVVDSLVRELGRVTVKNPTADPETGLAKDATLEAVRALLANEDFASQATLEAVRALLAGEDFSSEATLAAIRDTVMRRTDPLAAGSNMVGRVQLDQAASHFVTPSTSLKVEQQRFFIVTSGRLALTTNGFFRGLFTNPAGSGRTMRVVRMASFTSQGPAFAEVYKNPTTGLPTTAQRPVTNAQLAAVFQSVAELRVDVSQGVGAVPLGGGTDTGWVFGMPGGQRTTLDLPPLVVPAGTSIGVNIPFTGAADATLSMYFIEE